MLEHMKVPEDAGDGTDGYAVYHWPEFKALCERLGVRWGLPTTNISIRLEIGRSPQIIHEYSGADFHKAIEARMVDTTSMQNEAYHTKAMLPVVPHPDKLL